MNTSVYLVNAFGIDTSGGNPAGVVLDADNFSSKIMQVIAKKVGFSETAFISKSDKADFQLRFFTPTDEVGICGHASIASFFLLHKLSKISSGTYKQETKAGLLDINVDSNGVVFMQQTLPSFLGKVDEKEIALAFGTTAEKIHTKNLVPEIVSTGLKDILLPVSSRKELFNLIPNNNKIKAINKKTETVGFHAFTLETLSNNSTAHCRNFAPLFGIDEEAATGSSSGALASYLFKHKAISKTKNLVFEQGYSMNKPSEIIVNLETINGKIKKVEVGGKAELIKKTDIST